MDNKNHRPPVTHYNKTKNGLKIAVWNARKKKKHQSLTFYQVRDLFFACVFLKVQTASFSISYIRFAEKIDDKLNEKRDIVRICENHPVNKLEGLGEIYWPHTISMGSFPMIDIITLMYFCAGRFALSILGTNARILKKKKRFCFWTVVRSAAPARPNHASAIKIFIGDSLWIETERLR